MAVFIFFYFLFFGFYFQSLQDNLFGKFGGDVSRVIGFGFVIPILSCSDIAQVWD